MHEAKTHLSQLVERALAGEEIVLTRRGEPAVRLVPEHRAGGFAALAGVWKGRASRHAALKLLLDTHLVLWWMAGEPSRISEKALAALGSEGIEPIVSAVTVWEAAIKRGLGKLEAPTDMLAQLEGAGVELLPITPRHADLVAALPLHHRDPFDRGARPVLEASKTSAHLSRREPIIAFCGISDTRKPGLCDGEARLLRRRDQLHRQFLGAFHNHTCAFQRDLEAPHIIGG
jgi:PIN domain nuclease of toxin-antitoxin system/antitoxin (DNA-binding transcriptional repressor) of toxin-antitoxin stability system